MVVLTATTKTGAPGRIASALAPLSLPLILAYICITVAWLLPGHYIPWPSFQQEAATGFGFLLIGVTAIQVGRTRWPALAVGMALTAVVPWLQWVGGIIFFRSDALTPSAYLLASAACIAAGATLAASDKRDQLLDGWSASVLAAGFVSVGMALWQWISRTGWGFLIEAVPPGARPFANLAQPNHLATLLALGLMATLYWYEKRRIGGIVASLSSLWLGFGLVLTESRTGWLFVALLLIWTLVMKRRAALQLPVTAMLAGAILFALTIPATKAIEQLIWADPTAVAQVRSFAPGLRWIHWQVLLDAAWKSPWVGYGWNQVAVAQYATVMDFPRTGEALTHSHNLIVDLLVENGLVAGGLMVAGLVAWFALNVARCRDASTWAMLASVGAIFLHAMLEYPLHYLNFLLPASLLMGALATTSGPALQLPRFSLAILVAALGVFFAMLSDEYIRAEESMRRLRLANARIGVTTAADLAVPKLMLLDAWTRYFETAQPKGAGLSADELRTYRHIALRFTYRRSVLVYARVAVLNGQDEEAKRILAYLCHVQSEGACSEEKQLWALAQESEPELRRVNFPPTRPLGK